MKPLHLLFLGLFALVTLIWYGGVWVPAHPVFMNGVQVTK